MQLQRLEKKGFTFKDIARKGKEKALETKVAQNLLENLPNQIRDNFTLSFLDHTIPVPETVLSYFTNNSDISCSVHKYPGSAFPFENLYLKQAVKPIDRYFLECTSGDQIHKRFLSLQKNLPKIISHKFNGHKLKIDNIGSGPGRDMISVLQKNNALVEKVHVRNIDPDSRALAIGKNFVNDLHFTSSFSFISKKLNEVQPRNADMLLVIGILCPMKLRVCKIVIKGLESFISSNGIIVYSTAQKRMLLDDPLTDYIMNFHGWIMDYKTDQEAKDIAFSQGWEVLDQFFDEPNRHHCMTVAMYKK